MDDHALFWSELQELISHQPDLTVCGQADSAPLALEQMRLLNPDLAIVDVSLGDTDGIELVKADEGRSPAPAGFGAFCPSGISVSPACLESWGVGLPDEG